MTEESEKYIVDIMNKIEELSCDIKELEQKNYDRFDKYRNSSISIIILRMPANWLVEGSSTSQKEAHMPLLS